MQIEICTTTDGKYGKGLYRQNHEAKLYLTTVFGHPALLCYQST